MIFIFLLALLAYPGLSVSSPDTKEANLVQASNDLSFDLMRFYKNEKNVFISPFSISTALGLVYLGSDGNTTRIMREVLKYNKYELTESDVHESFKGLLGKLKSQGDSYVLTSSNNVFVQKDFIILHIYGHAVRIYYNADIETVDFAEGQKVRSRINSIVENATRGKIKDFLAQPPSANTKLFLLNAVYFLGTWRTPFDPEITSPRPFYNQGVTAKQVPTMFRHGSYKISQSKELAAQLIVLPYKGNDSASMVLVLPDQRNGVADLQNKLDKNAFDNLLNAASSRRVALSMPKYKLNFKTDLGSALTDLGLGELFSNWANLTRLAGEQHLQVSKVNHQAVIDVDEKGSEAAAVTGVEIVPTSLPPRFAIDHPFLFFIRDDKTGLVLFSGRVDEL